MDLRIKIDGFSIGSCARDAVITNGTNSITQRSLQKQNTGSSFISSGQLRIDEEVKRMIDWDELDHCVWNGTNWTV